MNQQTNTYVAIMAGGIGSRFWPASRTATPKQFLDILGIGKSLLRLTFERFLNVCPASNIFIVTNALYRELVLEHLPEITANQVLCEPSRNNTAPCIAYTAFKLHHLNPEANLVVAPSDHVILKEEAFVRQLQQALDFTAHHNALLTLGIQPTRPDTGYGYIHYEKNGANGIHKVRQFREKPDKTTAKSFIESGDYLWNAGIFIWSTKSILNAFQQLSPEIFDLFSKGENYWNTPEEQAFVNEYYPLTKNISIDYAIMEKASNVFTIPSEIGWSDLGTWGSLHAESEQSAEGNVFQAKMVLTENVRNTLLRVSSEKLVVLRDLDGYIIVDEPDVLMIYPLSQEQNIKTVTTKVQTHFGDTYI